MNDAAQPQYLMRYWDDVVVGQTLTPVTLDINYTRAIQNVAASRDWMRGHHDPDYARRQGQPTVFLNTTFHQALVDRLVTDWAGPHCFIQRRTLQMVDALLAGDVARAEGEVIEMVDCGDGEYGLIVANVHVAHARGTSSKARVMFRLPRRVGNS
jgi:hypothetical protein